MTIHAAIAPLVEGRTLDHLTNGENVVRTANTMRFTPRRHRSLIDIVSLVAPYETLIEIKTDITPGWMWLHFPSICGEPVSTPYFLARPAFQEEDFATVQLWCQLAIISRGWRFLTEATDEGICSTVSWGENFANNKCADPILSLLMAYLRALRQVNNYSTSVEL